MNNTADNISVMKKPDGAWTITHVNGVQIRAVCEHGVAPNTQYIMRLMNYGSGPVRLKSNKRQQKQQQKHQPQQQENNSEV